MFFEVLDGAVDEVVFVCVLVFFEEVEGEFVLEGVRDVDVEFGARKVEKEVALVFHSADEKAEEGEFFDFFDVFDDEKVQFVVEDFFELEFLFDFEVFDGDFAFGEEFDLVFFVDVEDLELDDVGVDEVAHQIPDFEAVFLELGGVPIKHFFFFGGRVFLFFGDEDGDEFGVEVFFGDDAENFVHCGFDAVNAEFHLDEFGVVFFLVAFDDEFAFFVVELESEFQVFRGQNVLQRHFAVVDVDDAVLFDGVYLEFQKLVLFVVVEVVVHDEGLYERRIQRKFVYFRFSDFDPVFFLVFVHFYERIHIRQIFALQKYLRLYRQTPRLKIVPQNQIVFLKILVRCFLVHFRQN